MSDYGLCKLCQDNLAVNINLKVDSASRKLLQSLLKSYQIDASILEESSGICKECIDIVSQINETLEKWSKAQEVLKASPLDIDDSKIFQIKLEPDSDVQFSEIQVEHMQTGSVLFIKEEEPQTEDVGYDMELIEEVSTNDSDDEVASSENSDDEVASLEDSDEDILAKEAGTDWRSSLENFFCVCLGPDGLALTILFKDTTKEKNIRMLCTCCNQLFATLSDIRKHASVTRVHPEYWCGVCDAIYSSIFELKIHEKIKRHFRPKTRAMVMRCLKCGTRSKHLSDAIKHDRSTHDRSTLMCHKCKVSFESRDSFQKHLLKHQTYMSRYPNCLNRNQLRPNYTSYLAWHKNQRTRCPVHGSTSIIKPMCHDQRLRTHLEIQERGKI